jgi:hypothetical protein
MVLGCIFPPVDGIERLLKIAVRLNDHPVFTPLASCVRFSNNSLMLKTYTSSFVFSPYQPISANIPAHSNNYPIPTSRSQNPHTNTENRASQPRQSCPLTPCRAGRRARRGCGTARGTVGVAELVVLDREDRVERLSGGGTTETALVKDMPGRLGLFVADPEVLNEEAPGSWWWDTHLKLLGSQKRTQIQILLR